MEGLEQDGAVAESSTAEASTAATTPPGAQTGTTGSPSQEPPFHQHPRWIERQREIEGLRGTNGQLSSQVQSLTQRLQQLETKAQGPGLTEDQRFEYQKAGNALKSVIAEHPELRGLLKLAEHADTLLQGYQGVGQISKAQAQAATRQGRAEITSLAEKAGLSTDAKYVGRIERLIAAEIFEDKQALERYQAGDLSVIGEKFKIVTDEFLGQTRRQAQTTVIDTKNKTRQLPPVSRGGAPGADAPASLKPDAAPGEVRQYREGLHKRGADMLSRLQGGA